MGCVVWACVVCGCVVWGVCGVGCVWCGVYTRWGIRAKHRTTWLHTDVQGGWGVVLGVGCVVCGCVVWGVCGVGGVWCGVHVGWGVRGG